MLGLINQWKNEKGDVAVQFVHLYNKVNATNYLMRHLIKSNVHSYKIPRVKEIN